MAQMTLSEAQNILGRVVENPEGSFAISARELAEACAVVLVRNGLLAGRPDDG